MAGSTPQGSGVPAAAQQGSQPQVPAVIYLQLMSTVLLWGFNWTLTKGVLHDISPVDFVAFRFGGAVFAMAALTLAMRGSLLPLPGERLDLAILGAVQMGGSQFFSTVALNYVGAGRTIVLLYTLQLWALPLSWLVNRERLTARALCGGLLGFAGMILFVNPALVDWHDYRVLIGNAIGLCGGFSWALGACFYRRRAWQSSFWTQTWWQVVWSAVAAGVFAALFARHSAITWNWHVLAVLTYNWIGPTMLCWLFWGKALAVMPAWRAGQVVALTPVVGMIVSAIFTGEQITATVALSIVLICTGTWISLGGKQKPIPAGEDG